MICLSQPSKLPIEMQGLKIELKTVIEGAIFIAISSALFDALIKLFFIPGTEISETIKISGFLLTINPLSMFGIQLIIIIGILLTILFFGNCLAFSSLLIVDCLLSLITPCSGKSSGDKVFSALFWFWLRTIFGFCSICHCCQIMKRTRKKAIYNKNLLFILEPHQHHLHTMGDTCTPFSLPSLHPS